MGSADGHRNRRMRRRIAPSLPAAVLAALLVVAGTAWLEARAASRRSRGGVGGSESVVAFASGVLRSATADRPEVLRDGQRREKRPSSVLVSVAATVAACVSCVLLAARELVSTGAGRRTFAAIAWSFAGRSPPS